MTQTIIPIDVPTLVKDFQKLVVDLKESEKVNRSLSYAHQVVDVIQRRCGDSAVRQLSGQDLDEHKISRNEQLRDLDNENRQLRQLYEDAQWTLHLVMEAHRRLVGETFGKYKDVLTLRKRTEEELDNMREEFYTHAACMTNAVYGVFEHERKMSVKFHKRMEELKAENEILRSILECESGAETKAITDNIERRAREQSAKPFQMLSSRLPANDVKCADRSDDVTLREKSTLSKNLKMS